MELPLHPSDPAIDTTRQEKVARRKRSLLELATELGNVNKACRVMGYPRQQFCEFRRNLQTFGAEGPLDRLWAKNTLTLGRDDYQRQYELILYGWRGSDHYKTLASALSGEWSRCPGA